MNIVQKRQFCEFDLHALHAMYLPGRVKLMTVTLTACLLISCAAAASDLVVTARLDSNTVYRGDSVTLSIEVEGAAQPLAPDISDIAAGGIFSVKPLGRSTKVTIVNWEKHSVVEFSYELTPLKAGSFTLPALKVAAGAKTASTRPLQITVRSPGESEDFKLRYKLPTKDCFVGEPVTITLIWYVNKDVNQLKYAVPLLSDKRFDVVDIDQLVDRWNQGKIDRRNYLPVKISGDDIVLARGSGWLEGKQYTTLSFRRVIIPKTAGVIHLPAATVICDIVTGYQMRRTDPFGDPFNTPFFNRGRRAITNRTVVSSDTPGLRVKSLPTQGRLA